MTDPPKRLPIHRDPQQTPPLPGEFAAALGNLVAWWVHVEAYVADIIKKALGLPDLAASVVTTELTFAQRLTMATTLIREARIQEASDDWQDILQAIEPVQASRNRYVHSFWYGHMDGTQTQFHERARGSVTRTLRTVPTQEVRNCIENVLCILDLLANFVLDHLGSISSNLAQNYPTKPPLTPGQGRKARAQVQARENKQSRRAADRQRSPKPGA